MEHRVTDIGSKRYRWLYELRLFKNPVFFLLVFKIFFCIWLVISLFVLSLDLVEGLPAKTLEGTLLFMLLMGLILLLLLIVSYGFYALIMRGRYTILFEMDEKGIAHIQVSADHDVLTRIPANLLNPSRRPASAHTRDGIARSAHRTCRQWGKTRA